MIKVGSDFSGVGAFDFALKRLEIKYQNVFACDIDKYAKISYEANHSADNFYENVYNRPIPCESLDIYMTSPPCQAFSIAGNRQGEQDSRGVLFYNSVEFIRQNKPKVFIFENVKGLLSADKGKIFKKWIDHLSDGFVNGEDCSFLSNKDALPYNIFYKVLNSKDYGVPQNRERIFIVGIRKDINFNYIFPEPIKKEPHIRDVIDEGSVKDKHYYTQNSKIYPLLSEFVISENSVYQYRRVYVRENKSNVCPTLTANMGTGGHNVPIIKTDKGIRKLTPKECFNLQGFPRDFNIPLDLAQSQLYKQVGNSITVNVLSEIVRNLFPIFKIEKNTLTVVDDTSKRLKDVLLDDVEKKYFLKNTELKNIKSNTYSSVPKIMVDGNVNPSGKGMNGNVYNSNGLCPTLTTNKGEGIKIKEAKGMRRLTPLECWRLQGFNDNEFYNAQNKGISNSQLYKQAGNSITVNVLSEIIRNLLPIFFTLQTKK